MGNMGEVLFITYFSGNTGNQWKEGRISAGYRVKFTGSGNQVGTDIPVGTAPKTDPRKEPTWTSMILIMRRATYTGSLSGIGSQLRTSDLVMLERQPPSCIRLQSAGAYSKPACSLENAADANHASTRTTQLYDRRSDG
jgi:hypothetical protein